MVPNLIPAWLRAYKADFLRQDVTGGLTVAAIVVPKAMACALIAGLPVEVGLYTALATMFVYPLLGSSRVLSVTTTTAIAILTSAQIVRTMSLNTGATAVEVAATLAVVCCQRLELMCASPVDDRLTSQGSWILNRCALPIVSDGSSPYILP